MAIPTSKPLSLSTVQTEYGGSNPISMSEYRGKGNAPASGPIDLWGDFNGTSNITTYTSSAVYANEYTSYTNYSQGTLGDRTSSWTSLISNQNYNSSVLNQSSDIVGGRMRNTTLASTFSGKTISAVRTCTVYMKARYEAQGSDNGTVFLDPLKGAYSAPLSTSSGTWQTSDSFQTGWPFEVQLSWNAITELSTSDLHDFIRDGFGAQFRLVCDEDDSGFGTRNTAAIAGYWVDIDFDYV